MEKSMNKFISSESAGSGSRGSKAIWDSQSVEIFCVTYFIVFFEILFCILCLLMKIKRNFSLLGRLSKLLRETEICPV